jgi:hypothetical protein
VLWQNLGNFRCEMLPSCFLLWKWHQFLQAAVLYVRTLYQHDDLTMKLTAYLKSSQVDGVWHTMEANPGSVHKYALLLGSLHNLINKCIIVGCILSSMKAIICKLVVFSAMPHLMVAHQSNIIPGSQSQSTSRFPKLLQPYLHQSVCLPVHGS